MTDIAEQRKERRKKTAHWFRLLHDRLCNALEALENEALAVVKTQEEINLKHKIEHRQSEEKQSEEKQNEEKQNIETPCRFVHKTWRREGDNDTLSEKEHNSPSNEREDGGGGEMALLRGKVFEKAGVNVSCVHGTFIPELRREVKGAAENGKFWASGVSLVVHPSSPRVPALHFNSRYIESAYGWFGGGGDLTPNEDDPEMREIFHNAFRRVCDKFEQGRYEAYTKACDAYFTIQHRNRVRGAGGIFFDNLNDNWQRDFEFVRETGEAFLATIPRIVKARMYKPWDAQQRAQQLRVRGLYAEFNLVYDRGTRFGLLTKGNPEAVLMSLPPLAAW